MQKKASKIVTAIVNNFNIEDYSEILDLATRIELPLGISDISSEDELIENFNELTELVESSGDELLISILNED